MFNMEDTNSKKVFPTTSGYGDQPHHPLQPQQLQLQLHHQPQLQQQQQVQLQQQQQQHHQHPQQQQQSITNIEPERIYIFPNSSNSIVNQPAGLSGASGEGGVGGNGVVGAHMVAGVSNRMNSIFDTVRSANNSGHSRSVSHGGGAFVPGIPASRPSALKSAVRGGHQRALSQGQITDGSSSGNSSEHPTRSGHSRVGSKTDFILPPGHKDAAEGRSLKSSTLMHTDRGHSRQASRTESIYTLRREDKPSWWKRLIFYHRKNKFEEHRYRFIVPNHTVPSKTPKRDHPNASYVGNKIRTTKYTLLSFLPKNLLEQFHRVANLYFIFIVLLNWFPQISAFGKEIAMIPVLFVLGVTAIKDLFEDRRRRASDNRINNSTCRVYRRQSDRYHRIKWAEVNVGDLVHLSNNETVPADILLLRTSDPYGIGYIDTCDLDGETNLKRRQVVQGFEEKQVSFSPSLFVSRLEVEAPTTKIYRFHGAMIHSSGVRVPLTTENLLLRESRVKNTNFVEGMVVYAGHETKTMLNNSGPRYKRSQVEQKMNVDVIWCVIILLILCVVGAVGYSLWLKPYENLVIPFLPTDSDPSYDGFLAFWTFIIILQIMIPLSLYVTIELCKILQVYHIHNNIQLYDSQSNKRTECRAMNITEELGQIQYIFSDKTGTLTENKMIFRRCNINGIDYIHPPTAEEKRISLNSPPPDLIPNTDLFERRMEQNNMKCTASTLLIQEFFLILSICNTVVVCKTPHKDILRESGQASKSISPDLFPSAEGDRYARLSESRSITPSPPNSISIARFEAEKANKNNLAVQQGPLEASGSVYEQPKMEELNDPKRKASIVTRPIYEAESPDELTLVNAAYSYEYQLIHRSPNLCVVMQPDSSVAEYEVLKILPFDSNRKCMSVIVRRRGTKDIILYTKGADSSIMPALAPAKTQQDIEIREQVQVHLDVYAREGLRVLVMAKRYLSQEQYNEWQAKHVEYETAQENREKKVRESFLLLERDLILVGSTGIEDRLQEGVPETIQALIQAGIVVWVLTGDKTETAINVAYSAKLFNSDSEILKLTARSKNAAENSINFYLNEIESNIMDNSNTAIRLKKTNRALVVDGKTLTFILDLRSNLTQPFLQLTKYCSAVLCCRSTPLQKAFLVKTVKEELKMSTLSIGDGANDVSMIQMADVGVGICGQEGMQAVMASDFAVPKFKMLKNLLLVHGHYNYDRLSRLILYFFYKNAAFVFVLFWFQLYCGFSGAVMIDQIYLMIFNFVFTSLPPIAIGVYDKKLSEDILMDNPKFYRHGRLGKGYKSYGFWVVMLDALYQSLVIFFVAEMAYWDSDVGLWEFGTTIVSSCLITMLLHCSIEFKTWTIIHVVTLLFSFFSFYFLAFLYNTYCVSCFSLPSNYWVIHECVSTWDYHLVIWLTVVLSLLPRMLVRVFVNTLRPGDTVTATLESRRNKSRGDDLLVTWSRSTSASSIYRAVDYGAKNKTKTVTTIG